MEMTILVLGASGATGRLLVKQLLMCGHQVKAMVRTPKNLPKDFADHQRLTVIHANLMDLSISQLRNHVLGCDAVVSCLGHNLTFKGVFGAPRRLVTNATERVYEAIQSFELEKPIKYVLMNTAGNSNRNIHEKRSLAHRCVIGLLRRLLPPHADNEAAADFLRIQIGQKNASVEWVVVRPDTLINEPTPTEYTLYASPVRDAIFNAGKTSRINVAHFMAKLITYHDTWEAWKGQMPVIYNIEKPKTK